MSSLRSLLIAMVFAVVTVIPITARSLRQSDEVTAAITRLRQMPLHPVEGLWQFPGEPAVIEIRRDSAHVSGGEVGRYLMILIRPVSKTADAGTTVGTLVPTGKYGVYDARIYSELPSGRHRVRPASCLLSLDDEESRLVMKSYGKKLHFKWWRLMPYMFRFTFTETEIRRGDVDGLVRIYPEPAIPINPVYL